MKCSIPRSGSAKYKRQARRRRLRRFQRATKLETSRRNRDTKDIAPVVHCSPWTSVVLMRTPSAILSGVTSITRLTPKGATDSTRVGRQLAYTSTVSKPITNAEHMKCGIPKSASAKHDQPLLASPHRRVVAVVE